jgi:hypothetical protein
VTVVTPAEPAHLEAIAALAEEMDRFYGATEVEPLGLRLLPPDRLRRFLKAFRVEIHYDVRTGRGDLQSRDQRQNHRRAGRTSSSGARSPLAGGRGVGSNVEMSDRQGSALPGEAQTIMRSSFGLCPRRVPYNMGTRCHRLERHVRDGCR